MGIFFVLGGSLLYTYVKMSENKLQEKLAPPPPVQQSTEENAEEEV